MIERLIIALRALAAEADVQLRRFPDFVSRPDELALDFADALLLVRSCQQIELAPEQSRALATVESLLDRLSGSATAELWTEAALRERPEWDQLRDAAATALRALGYPVEPPPPTDSVYVPGRRLEP